MYCETGDGVSLSSSVSAQLGSLFSSREARCVIDDGFIIEGRSRVVFKEYALLNWLYRLKIAVAVTCGLDYLHKGVIVQLGTYVRKLLA